MQNLTTDELGEQICQDIADNHIQLPTLPEVALKVRDAVENDTASASDVAAMVTNDPALSARLIQVANSPLYRGRVAIDNVQMAVTRMGLKLVKSLVVSLAMKQIFQATSEALDKAFRGVWNDSVEVAAIARVLADNVKGLEAEQAMLAGLVHNIGTLPILTRLDEIYGYNANAHTINHVIEVLTPKIGCQILEQWHFTDTLARVPCESYDLERDSETPDYCDLVLVARLQHLAASGRLNKDSAMERWPTFPAFAKIGIETEVIVLDMDGPAEQIAQVRDMLHS
jgi:HD-like signal output (HDOD) protein